MCLGNVLACGLALGIVLGIVLAIVLTTGLTMCIPSMETLCISDTHTGPGEQLELDYTSGFAATRSNSLRQQA